MNNKFYVYTHTRPDTGKVFYVGKGCGRRAWEINAGRRGRYHQNIVKKLKKIGLDVVIEIVSDCMSEPDAFSLEIETIATFRALGHVLANRTNGGEGASGSVQSEKTKKKKSEKMKKHCAAPEVRKARSESARRQLSDQAAMEKFRAANAAYFANPDSRVAISERMKNSWEDEGFRNKAQNSMRAAWEDPEAKERRSKAMAEAMRTPEARAKRSAAQTKRWSKEENREAVSRANSKLVFCLETGEIYKSMTSASKILEIAISSISLACNGHKASAKGLHFSFVESA